MVVFKDQTTGSLSRQAGDFYQDVVIPGNYFSSLDSPGLQDYVAQYSNVEIVKAMAIVSCLNRGSGQKSITLMQGPVNAGAAAYNYTATRTPAEQPRSVTRTIGNNTSSKSNVTLVATGNLYSASGSKTYQTKGDGVLLTAAGAGGMTSQPTAYWDFFLTQGNGSAAAGNETDIDNINYTVTVYRTCRFFKRKIIYT